MTIPDNPFVGLRPFESEDSLYYFGRNEQSKTLLRQLHQHRFVAVVGSSGSGKSSLIRAGLIPQLEAGFLVQDRDQWCVARLKPGDAPLGNLVEALRKILPVPPEPRGGFSDSEHPHPPAPSPLQGEGEQSQSVAMLVNAIREQGTQAIVDLLEPLLRGTDANLFILVDQFEELFRFGLGKGKSKADRQEAEEFVALLLSLTRHELPIYVCLTMRSDFLGDCDAFYGLPEAINQSQFLVPRLTRQQRQEVITHPVHLAGAKMTPRLVDRLLNEGIDTRDDLPVLQHVLMRTWDVWQDSGDESQGLPLDVSHYEAAGGIHRALNLHAEEALNDLNEFQQGIAKKLFQALTGLDSSNRQIRRPAHLHKVALISETTPSEVLEVINFFRADRREFLILTSDKISDNPLIDISHESLIRQWKTLYKWADQEFENSRIYLRLIDSSQLYKSNKANPYHGEELDEAIKWKQQFNRMKTLKAWTERYYPSHQEAIDFIQWSVNIEIRTEQENKKTEWEHEELRKEKIKLEREQAKITKERLLEQRTVLARFRWVALLLGLSTIGLFTFSYMAWHYSTELEKERFKSTLNYSNTLSVISNLSSEKNPFSGKNLEVLEKINRIASIDSKYYIYTFKSNPSINIKSGTNFSPDGRHIAIANKNTVIIKKVENLRSVYRVLSSNSAVTSIAFSPTKNLIAAGYQDSRVKIWSVNTGKLIKNFRNKPKAVIGLRFSPNSSQITAIHEDEKSYKWDIETGKIISESTINFKSFSGGAGGGGF